MRMWGLLGVYFLVMLRVVWVENPDLNAIQRFGAFFMYLLSGWALMYFSWLYFEVWGAVAEKVAMVRSLRILLIPLTPVGFWTSWRFGGGDPVLIAGLALFLVCFLLWGESLMTAFRRFFLSRPGNEKFYESFSSRWHILPFDVVYLGINAASLFFCFGFI